MVEKYRLSAEEIHECRLHLGQYDLGYLEEGDASAIGQPAGPVRLQAGIPGPKGFGYRHIRDAQGREAKIKGLGFASIEAFSAAVAKNYHKIFDAEDGKIALIFNSKGYDLGLILRYSQAGFWSITTALPNRVFRKNEKLLVARADRSESPSKIAEPSRFETLSLPKAKAFGGSGS